LSRGHGEGWTGSAESVEYRPARGMLLLLLGLMAVLLLFAGALLWYVATVGFGGVHPALPYALGAAFAAIGLFLALGSAATFLYILTGRAVFPSAVLRWLLVRLYLPLVVTAGGLLGVDKTRIERAFIEINNRMVLSMKKALAPESLLVLMPHCIQYDDCYHKMCDNMEKLNLDAMLSISKGIANVTQLFAEKEPLFPKGSV